MVMYHVFDGVIRGQELNEIYVYVQVRSHLVANVLDEHTGALYEYPGSHATIPLADMLRM